MLLGEGAAIIEVSQLERLLSCRLDMVVGPATVRPMSRPEVL
jgi:hypothetical protein